MNGGAKKKKTVSDGNAPWNVAGFEISLWNLCGVFVCFFCAGLYVYLVSQIHDARVFFSGITEVEREISFRTENGLYYSYYKQLVHAPSFIQGLSELMNDKQTEHPSSINVLSRMNIYQEVFLAFIYRFCPFIANTFPPIFFYTYFIFLLTFILITSLFLLSWSISGSWLSGLLAYILYIYHWNDITRVETYMPLRENFALPFLWLQLFSTHLYFKHDFSPVYENLIKASISSSTFLFGLTWQFNQFAFLLQAAALVTCQVLDLVPSNKLRHLYHSLLFSMLAVSLLQFINTMILTGFLVSFLVAALLLLKLQTEFPYDLTKTSITHICHVIINIIFVITTTIIINFVVKTVIPHQADEHINKFLLTKFGFNSSIDFDVKLYLCNGGFNFLDADFPFRLGFTMILYVTCHLCLLVLLLVSVLATFFRLQRDASSIFSVRMPPELSYHCIQMLTFGAVAVIALRMKYFWTPYMCVFASVCVFKWDVWMWLVGRLLKDCKEMDRKMKHVTSAIGIIIIAYYGNIAYSSNSKEINNLREFYDPDTVDLMNWINNSTAAGSSFSGSMQLMAAVKLSTLRPITNHPHYEDKSLRVKTKDLSKVYGRFSPEVVHSMLRHYDTNYVILEDSICLTPYNGGCGMTYIMDTELGLEYSDLGVPIGDHSQLPPRFCDQVRNPNGLYAEYFKLVMMNKTFRIYQVL